MVQTRWKNIETLINVFFKIPICCILWKYKINIKFFSDPIYDELNDMYSWNPKTLFKWVRLIRNKELDFVCDKFPEYTLG